MALCFNQQFTLRFFADVTLLDTEYFWLLIAVLGLGPLGGAFFLWD